MRSIEDTLPKIIFGGTLARLPRIFALRRNKMSLGIIKASFASAFGFCAIGLAPDIRSRLGIIKASFASAFGFCVIGLAPDIRSRLGIIKASFASALGFCVYLHPISGNLESRTDSAMPANKNASLRIERNLFTALRPFIISAALPMVIAMLQKDAVRVAFSSRKNRTLGYYCPPKDQNAGNSGYHRNFDSLHTISLQVDLNPYALLFVFIHEWAHLATRKRFGSKAAPHGREWRENFKNLFAPFHTTDIFPSDILSAIDNYFIDTSPYFESQLEEACSRYGKDRKAFARAYEGFLRQGILIPAPYMGPGTEKRIIQCRLEYQEKKKREELEQAARIRQELKEMKKKEQGRPVSCGFFPVQQLPAGTWIRIDGKEYRIEEQGRPLIRVKDPASGQEARIHYLLQAEVLSPPA